MMWLLLPLCALAAEPVTVLRGVTSSLPPTGELSVVEPPAHGRAEVQGEHLLYHHDGSTEGQDQLIFRLCDPTCREERLDLRVLSIDAHAGALLKRAQGAPELQKSWLLPGGPYTARRAGCHRAYRQHLIELQAGALHEPERAAARAQISGFLLTDLQARVQLARWVVGLEEADWALDVAPPPGEVIQAQRAQYQGMIEDCPAQVAQIEALWGALPGGVARVCEGEVEEAPSPCE